MKECSHQWQLNKMRQGCLKRKGDSDKAKWQVQQSLREEALSTIMYPSLRRKIWGLPERQSRPPSDSTQTALVDLEDLALRNGQGHAYPSARVRGRHIWWNQLLPAQLLC